MMTKFFIKITLFSIFPIVSLYGILLLDNGRTDPFYRRFTTPKQSALILGNSKAAQGIVPEVLNSELEDVFNTKIYNYSFTVYNSPYGPVYLESIKRKLKDGIKGSYFIVTVDPWSISSYKEAPNDTALFDENHQFLKDIEKVDLNPNWYYIKDHYRKSFYEIPLQWIKPGYSKLHQDGWFETTGEMKDVAITKRRKFMVNFYEGYLKKYSFSQTRFNYLKQTISFLSKYGKVFLVRMPLHPDILNIEEKVIYDFDFKMKQLSKEKNIPYKDFNNISDVYVFKDGLHLDPESGKNLSVEISKWIRKENRHNLNDY
ncbi:hypothetical protein [Echinicola salinicaeni]|uniref:hypothetical protein n=1 Tax=Echinicola salinicaeni TaxID=2762757 RepID=UPI00164468A6|nr:hypothetical protein [Echinicola salinicaeni]